MRMFLGQSGDLVQLLELFNVIDREVVLRVPLLCVDHVSRQLQRHLFHLSLSINNLHHQGIRSLVHASLDLFQLTTHRTNLLGQRSKLNVLLLLYVPQREQHFHDKSGHLHDRSHGPTFVGRSPVTVERIAVHFLVVFGQPFGTGTDEVTVQTREPVVADG
uniref:(northern house mosquito) hypothetical protein n=1 Tax=Culex pipiens TaxID=7175 RepID=A0A8D8GH63_CULPI